MEKNNYIINLNKWLIGNYDQHTQDEILRLKKENPIELSDAFYKDLEFGTGGLRGIMGVGPNRINQYTIGTATQGVANYLKKNFPNEILRVAVAYDSRNNSRYFAEVTVNILSANHIYCYLFEELRPVPELSFAVRQLKCHAGIMITASHNPKEYNGYKVYGNDGAQFVAPQDRQVMDEVLAISSNEQIQWEKNSEYIQFIGANMDNKYFDSIRALSLNPASIKKKSEIKILYTPLHGTGITLIPKALELFGFKNVIILEEQATPDGNFSTIPSPNPEERATMLTALEKGEKLGVDLVLATDPDSDRMGVAARNSNGKLELLNGNMTASLLGYYILSELHKKKLLKGNEFIAKTIVTTDLITEIAVDFNVEYVNVLTGFKYIAQKIKEFEGEKQYVFGGEESYGCLIGDFVRDKDAVSACCMMAELVAHLANDDKSLFDLLKELYVNYGFFKERLISFTKKGKAGDDYIKKLMFKFRQQPPRTIFGSKVISIHDYLSQRITYCSSRKSEEIHLPKSNVLQFVTENESKITIRPSGTEPKIKFYISVKEDLPSIDNYTEINEKLNNRILGIMRSLKIDEGLPAIEE